MRGERARNSRQLTLVHILSSWATAPAKRHAQFVCRKQATCMYSIVKGAGLNAVTSDLWVLVLQTSLVLCLCLP